jgi:hypothetical protein
MRSGAVSEPFATYVKFLKQQPPGVPTLTPLVTDLITPVAA